MSTKRSVVLKGDPVYNEKGKASAQVNPGYLVKGVSVIAHQTEDSLVQLPKAFAVERDELGTGLDGTYLTTGNGTGNYYYASGDQVKVAVCGPGDVVTAFIASGETVSEDTLLSSAGDGTLEAAAASGADYVIGRALETLGTVAVVTACKVEIM